MKRGTFLKKLYAMIGVAAVAPAALATDTPKVENSKPNEHVVIHTYNYPIKKPDEMIVIHDTNYPKDLGNYVSIDGHNFELSLNCGHLHPGDIIWCCFSKAPKLYVHTFGEYEKEYESWKYTVGIIPEPFNQYNYERKYALPGTRFYKIQHVISNV